jgi:hypothetical protein
LWQNGMMNSRLRAIPLIVVAVLSSCARQPSVEVVAADEGPGLIEGIVVYEDGRPAQGASVSAFPLDRGLAAKVPAADTDGLGHFRISHLWLGEFAVTAKKEDEGYPDTSSGFYSDSKIAPIALSLSHPLATDTILLGPKAGILVGTVADAVTGALLDPCVDFHRASDPNNFLSGTGLINAKYRVLVPPDREVIMKIWHEGYLPWYYPGANHKTEAQPVRLKSGEERTLHIRLQPGNDASEAGCITSLCFPHCRS